MIKNKTILLFIVFLLSQSFFFTYSKSIKIIPEPVEIKLDSGSFIINKETKIIFDGEDSYNIAKYLASQLHNSLNYFLVIEAYNNKNNHNSIILSINNGIDKIQNESYFLNANKDCIQISATKANGLFYGVQTLTQLITPQNESKGELTIKSLTVPSLKIFDYPRFEWRGIMLDVSRHFFSKGFIKKYLDQLAKYKFNIFHWHLTDDNGWRVEIDGLPDLTDIGAWRAERKGPWASLPPVIGEKQEYGGYYTQEDIKEIIEYASERFITIVPEIDVPGHSLAMIASYPELSCSGEQYTINNGQGFGNEQNVLCASNEHVYELLDTVFSQIADLFPSEYIHVGGDEVNYSQWLNHEACVDKMERLKIESGKEYQNYFEKRIEKIIQSKGKKMLCWYGDYLKDLSPETAVYSWQGKEGGVLSSQQERNVIMTPDWDTYLDFYQGNPSSEPFSIIGGVLRLKHCYAFEIVPPNAKEKYILGGQGNLWTESVPNERHVEYMTWPRALALSEVFWSPEESRDWAHFLTKVEHHLLSFNNSNVKYATSFKDAIITGIKDEENGEWMIKLDSEYPNVDIYYTFDGTVVDDFDNLYVEQLLEIPTGATHIRVITYQDGKPLGKEVIFPLSNINNPLLR